jgi:hypothetical protein
MIAGFPGAHEVLLRTLPVKVTLRQVWEQALRLGADLVRRRDEDVQELLQGRAPAPPSNVPDLLVIAPDGGRLQDRTRPVGDRWCEYKAAVLYRVTREERFWAGLGTDPQGEVHWAYKVGEDGFQRIESKKTKQYRDPEPQVKTFVATTEKIDRFPLLVEHEALGRGLLVARTVAVVGDGQDTIWRTAKEVTADRRSAGQEVFEILDIIHAGEHLVGAAKAAQGVTKAGAAWLNQRLRELWRGEAAKLIAVLQTEATAVRSRKDTEAARILVNARDYFTEHRERVRYDVFRKHGLPLASCHIESAIKQTNRRVKGSEKQWLLPHAEEMLALRCLALSQDDRWDGYFEGLRQGAIAIPTLGRLTSAKQACPSIPIRKAS